MIYRVILTCNGSYKRTFHISKTKETSYSHYHQLIDDNKIVKFPKRYLNSYKIIPVKYEICVVKITEPTDIFRKLRNDYGKLYIEKPLGDWTILSSEQYNIEELFWIYGMDSRSNRQPINTIIKKLVTGAHKLKMVKQIAVVHNKLIIYNEEQFDMIICKCREDAKRLHIELSKICKKQKIKSLIFMTTTSKASMNHFYNIIQEYTGWKIKKILRTNTRP